MENKFVIIGAGSTHTPGILGALAAKADEIHLSELCLHDIEEDRVYHMGEFNRLYMQEHRPDIKTSYTTDLKEALVGADYVFIQIRPGRNEQRAIDEHTCYKHGLIGQETCGLGGFAFALRTIPAILEIVKTALEVCPKAWLLNYSNPEAMVSEAVYRVYPQAKMLCICDMPISQQEQVAGYLGYDEKDLTFKYFGLNHFGWFTHIYNKSGKDLLPQLREDVLSEKLQSFHSVEDLGKLDDYWLKTFNNVVKGMRAYPDFMPLCYLQYYYFHDEMMEQFDHEFTRADSVLAGREITVYQECKRVIEAQSTKDSYLVAGVHGNYIVDLASAIINDKRERFIINVMNNGAIGNFNHDAVVEVPCYVGASGIEPIAVGYIPQFHKSLMEAQKGYEKLAVEACLEGSYEKALQAILLNKTVPSYRKGKEILDEFLELNKDYWNPKFYNK